ncbi:MAG: 6-hydroxymethylpterin diphosphokinase MptE-like protein [Promethearchaeota archaeon]|jgi:uncharacterized Rossmann fold enzyme
MDSTLKDQLNFYNEFKAWYFKIIKNFDFDPQLDYEARNYLSDILHSKKKKYDLEKILLSFEEHIQNKPNILIYGCGPSLEETVRDLLNHRNIGIFENCINLAADGASVLLKKELIPISAIFTDLDGITKDEFDYPLFNVIHAHGDNIRQLNFFKNKIQEFTNIIGTTQVEPGEYVINPGGFTDGDRILYFIRTLINPSQKLILIGMDFKNVVGKYSKLDMISNQEGTLIKKRKLQYAVKLIKWLKSKISNQVFFMNSEPISKEFHYTSVEDFVYS